METEDLFETITYFEDVCILDLPSEGKTASKTFYINITLLFDFNGLLKRFIDIKYLEDLFLFF